MLLRFSIENYRSIRDEITLDMVPAKSRTMNDHIILQDNVKKTKALPVAAIYGANNAGKSNLVSALLFAKKLVTEGIKKDAPIDVNPFLLEDSYARKGSKFEFIFTKDNILYTYGFIVNKERVLEEWLFGYFSIRESLLFERVFNGDTYTLESGPKLVKNSKGNSLLNFMSRGTRPNTLFLRESQDHDLEILKPVYDWFKNNVQIITPDSLYEMLLPRANEEKDFLKSISSFLKKSGTGIDSIICEEKLFRVEDDISDVPLEIKKHVYELLSKEEPNRHLLLQGPKTIIDVYKDENNSIKYLNLKTRHININKQEIDFDTNFESDGTIRLIHLAPILSELRNSDYLYVIDELDRSFHTSLSRSIVEGFIENVQNRTSGSQLIFTTHDTNLLDRKLLRKDEIYFIDKDKHDSTKLDSLANYDVSDGLNYENGYLNGRFSAIPFYGDHQSLLG